jgi:hypothetical protein
MSRHLIVALCALAGALGLAAFSLPREASAGGDILHRVTCDRKGDAIVVRFGMSKRPTNFGVETPGDRFLYIVDPAKGIDHLGRAYKRDTLELGIKDTTGTHLDHGARSDEKVFGAPGQYTLRFQDANRTEYEGLHAFSCSVDIPTRAAVTDASNESVTCATKQSASTGLIADESGVPLAARMEIGCQASSGCSGHGGCCTRNLPGQPCYCNTYCLAKPASIATRIASNGSGPR